MAEIHLCAMGHSPGGPNITLAHSAFIRRREWPGGGTVPVLVLHIGLDAIEVWPFDREHVRALGQKLIELAEEGS